MTDGDGTGGGPWRPLRVPLFRNLLIADFVSDIGSFLQAVGAAWLMVSFDAGPFFVALTQTASSLPFFLLALPAGALGDIVDARRLILFTEVWMLGVSIVLAVATMAGFMSPWLLLALTFALSAGDALEAPTWRAIIPDTVSPEDLEEASALNGLEFNLARAVGPALAGLLVAVGGVAPAFALNALSFVIPTIMIARWRRPTRKGTAPVERLSEAIRGAVRYVRYSPSIRILLARTGSVTIFGSALLALLPSIAMETTGGALGYGLLLGEFGLGAVAGALLMPALRRSIRVEPLISLVTYVLGAAVVAAGAVRSLAALSVILVVAGAAWILYISVLTARAELIPPQWVRSRVLAVYLLVLQGSLALGSAAWGFIAQKTSVRAALILAGAGTAAAVLLKRAAPLAETVDDQTLWPHWRVPSIAPPLRLEKDDGPILVTVEYHIGVDQVPTFLKAIHQLARVRRRDGAAQWAVFRDSETSWRYLEVFVVSSWAGHLRQHERVTVADSVLETRVSNTLVREPKVTHFVLVDDAATSSRAHDGVAFPLRHTR